MKTTSTGRQMIAALALLSVGLSDTSAKSPEAVAQGRLLFQRDWTPTNPKRGSDGLGPLFNATSCASCHHQGGDGGAGEARFNAVSIGIDRLRITGGPVGQDVMARMVRKFHPGFVQPGGVVVNTLALSHHGGTPAFEKARDAIRENIPAEFGRDGGALNATEVRYSTNTPINYHVTDGKYDMHVEARMFQRNTTALFGAGLIDQVSDREIKAQAYAQRRHPEISGRPSTLQDGRFGKFGWRANVATLLEFNDQACANEVGLETRRRPQPADPTTPNYRNPSHDISDEQIEAIHAFVASLPAPRREIPKQKDQASHVRRGEELFASIGCSVCHVSDLGPAKGIYSDLLLHDMGYESYDLNHAEPYIRRINPVIELSTEQQIRAREELLAMQAYYGRSSTISAARRQDLRTPSNPSGRIRNGFEFVAPLEPPRVSRSPRIQKSVNNPFYFGTLAPVDPEGLVETRYTELRMEPTRFNQEWRTPPLWGLRDSAPYMHDGRAETVLEAISMHDGESAGTRDRFLNLSLSDRRAIIAFLDTLVAPAAMEFESL